MSSANMIFQSFQQCLTAATTTSATKTFQIQKFQQCLTAAAATTTTTPTTKTFQIQKFSTMPNNSSNNNYTNKKNTFQIQILSCNLLSIFGLQGCEVVGHIVIGPDHQVGHLRQHVNLAFSAKTKILF
jgi:hypothetical protein